jgi:hypothetical protein
MTGQALRAAHATDVEMWDTENDDRQVWLFHPLTDDSWHIVNRKNGLCLSSANGRISLVAESDSPDLKWRLVKDGDGYYALIHVGSGRVIDLANGEAANGARVVLWSDQKGRNQRWAILYSGRKTLR